MPSKKTLINKLFSRPAPTNYTTRELDTLMGKCGCSKYSGGRGSAVKYVHEATGQILEFDIPHPGKELYRYQINATKKFLNDIGEVK